MNPYSVWVFLLLAVEAIKMYRSEPYFKFVTSLSLIQPQLIFVPVHQSQQHKNPNLDISSRPRHPNLHLHPGNKSSRPPQRLYHRLYL